MMLNRNRARLLLVVTLAPPLLSVFAIASHDDNVGAVVFLFAGLLTFSLMVFYLIHLYGTAHLETGDRVLWLWLIVFGNILAMPVYWFFHVRPKPSDGAA